MYIKSAFMALSIPDFAVFYWYDWKSELHDNFQRVLDVILKKHYARSRLDRWTDVTDEFMQGASIQIVILSSAVFELLYGTAKTSFLLFQNPQDLKNIFT
jgi:hypothetical protein